MFLLETSVRDVLPSIEVGDKFIMNTDKGMMEFSTITKIMNNELVLSVDSNNVYKLNIDTAIDGNVLSLKKNDPKSSTFKIQFNYIKIEHKNGGDDTIIKPVIEDEEEDEEEETTEPLKPFSKEKAKKLKQLKDDVNVDREIITKDFEKLEIGNVFNIHLSEVVLEDNELVIDQTKNSILNMMVLDIGHDYIQCKFLGMEGFYAKKLTSLGDELFRFYKGENLINTSHNSGVALNIFFYDKSNKRIVLSDVIELEVIEDLELDDTDDIPNNIDAMLQDKGLMKLMQNKTWLDKLLGRDATGIIPSKKLLGIKDENDYVTFEYMGDTIRKDYKFSLVKNKKYRGKLLENGSVIRVLGSNRRESYQLTKIKNKGNTYIVSIKHIINNDSSEKQKITAYKNSKIKIVT